MSRIVWPMLPASWRIERLDELALVRYGKALRTEDRRGGSVTVFGAGGETGTHDEPLHLGPAIIVGRKGSVGSVHFARRPFWCIDTTFYLDRLHPDVDVEYLYLALRSMDLSRLAKGAGVPGLGRGDLDALRVPIPPLAEQGHIVQILREFHHIEKDQARAEAILQAAVESAWWECFGAYFWDRTRDMMRLGDLLDESQHGISEPMDAEGAHTIVRVNNITDHGWLDLTNLKYVTLSSDAARPYLLRDGDLLFNRTNSLELVGKTAIWRGTSTNYAFASQLVRLRLRSGVRPEYVWGTLNSAYGRRRRFVMAKLGFSMANISVSDLKRFMIPRVSESDQSRYVALVRECETIHEQQERARSLAAEHIQTVAILAVRGDLTRGWRAVHGDAPRAALPASRSLAMPAVQTEDGGFMDEERAGRSWLWGQISELQRSVATALEGRPGTLVAQDPDAFQAFITEHLHLEVRRDQVRVALDQVAALGLIAKVRLRREDERGEIGFVSGYRPLRARADELRAADQSCADDLRKLGELLAKSDRP